MILCIGKLGEIYIFYLFYFYFSFVSARVKRNGQVKSLGINTPVHYNLSPTNRSPKNSRRTVDVNNWETLAKMFTKLLYFLSFFFFLLKISSCVRV